MLFSVPFHIGPDGRRYLDPLWAKDLVEHTRYIERLVLAAPVQLGPLPANAVAIDDSPALRGVQRIELPPVHGYLDALRRLPRTWRLLWRASAGAAIIHSSVAAWPLPEAWLLAPLVRLRRCVHYINVESAFWRLVPGQHAGIGRRLQASVTERLNRLCIEAADISTFTQAGYRASLLRRNAERGHVVEASWIDAVNVLTAEQLAARQARPRSGALRLAYAGRLTVAKGIRLLLQGICEAVRAGHDISLAIFGNGPLEEECAQALRDPALAARVRLRGSVPYDAAFFEILRGFDLLVVPTLSDEQPRVVFDAYSQGLPVLASDSPGMLQCVAPGRTGRLFRSGDAASLRAEVERAVVERDALADMAAACVARARASTHEEMHRKRWQLLVTAFPSLALR